MRGLRAIFIVFIVLVTGTGLKGQVPAIINNFVSDTALRHASVSICIRDAETAEIILGFNEEKALSSASVMKLVTTAAALEMLGPDFRFTTRVGYIGSKDRKNVLNGDIVIKGGADPALLSEYFPDYYNGLFSLWINAMEDAGIKKVNGRVITDAAIFDYHPAIAGWSWADIGNYYGAGPHGLTIFDNMYRLHFKTAAEGTKPQLVFAEPAIPGLSFTNYLKAYGNSDNGYVYLEPYGSDAVIRGTIPPQREDFVLKAAIPDPPRLLSIMMRDSLIAHNIDVTGEPVTLRDMELTEQVPVNPVKTLFTTTYSPILAEIIKVTNKESVNLFAEHLLKYLAYSVTLREKATSEEGIETIKMFLDNRIGNHAGLYMADGSGLSRASALSSSFITSLLCYMNTGSSCKEQYFNSLPKAGQDGTLENYFKDEVFRDNLVAKSGTISRVRNYAGYFTTVSGRKVAFGILVSNADLSSGEVTHRIESLLKEIILQY